MLGEFHRRGGVPRGCVQYRGGCAGNVRFGPGVSPDRLRGFHRFPDFHSRGSAVVCGQSVDFDSRGDESVLRERTAVRSGIGGMLPHSRGNRNGVAGARGVVAGSRGFRGGGKDRRRRIGGNERRRFGGKFENGGNDAQILVRAKRETAVLAETVAKKTGDSYHYQLVVPRFHVSTSSFPRGRFRWNSVRPTLRSCSSPRFSPSTCPRRTAFPRWSVSSRSRAASSPVRSFPRFPT